MNHDQANVTALTRGKNEQVHDNPDYTIFIRGDRVFTRSKENGKATPGNVKDALDSIWCDRVKLAGVEGKTMSREMAVDIFRCALNQLHGNTGRLYLRNVSGSKSGLAGNVYLHADPAGFHLDLMRCMMATGFELEEHSDRNPEISKLPLHRDNG